MSNDLVVFEKPKDTSLTNFDNSVVFREKCQVSTNNFIFGLMPVIVMTGLCQKRIHGGPDWLGSFYLLLILL